MIHVDFKRFSSANINVRSELDGRNEQRMILRQRNTRLMRVCKGGHMIREALLVSVAVVLSAFSLSAASQTAEEWRRAAGSTGWGLIVWDSMRSECVSRQSDAKATCERGDLSCRPLGVKGMLQTREKLVRDLNQAKSDRKQTDVDRLERELSSLDSQVKGAQSEASRREEVNQTCAKQRRYVMALFDDAARKVEGMRNSDSNKAFFSDMDSDRDKLKRSIQDHVEEHDKATKRAAECRDIMNF